MISSVSPTSKRGGITSQSYPKHASVHGNLSPPYPYFGSRFIKIPVLGMQDSLMSSELREPLASRNKVWSLIATISVLSIKFHYIKLICHGSLLLIREHHRSIEDLSSHHLYQVC